jgi:disulfide bond formation protein DsbB
MTLFGQARALALLVPLALIAGALGSQYIGGLYPCEMCHWQRWPHYAAILLAVLAFVMPAPAAQRGFVLMAAIAIAISGGIGVYHAGVEYHFWQGFTQCSDGLSAGIGDTRADIWATPLIRCDVAQWTLFGISLAGFNAIFSLGGSALIMWLWLKSR